MSKPIGLALRSLTGLPPRRLALLASIAEQRGFDLPIVSARTMDNDWEAAIERTIEAFAPSLTHTSRW